MLSSIQPSEAASSARFCCAEALVSQLNAPSKEAPSDPEYSEYGGMVRADSRNPIRRSQLKGNVAKADELWIAEELWSIPRQGILCPGFTQVPSKRRKGLQVIHGSRLEF
jgi:hypothetical protein